MVFSSNIFLFLFLPIFLAAYFAVDLLAPKRWQQVGNTRKFASNCLLTLLSLVFYFIGSGYFTFVFLVCIVANYHFRKYLYLSDRPGGVLAVGLLFNISVLAYFKYFNFFYQQGSDLLTQIGYGALAPIALIPLPIGISFYTFMDMSALIDAYRKRQHPGSPLDFALYITLFPHLVAGPIVRYSEIRDEIHDRESTLDMVFEGITRFSQGLAKKVLLANPLALVADQMFSLPDSQLSSGYAWLGALCYTLQIYFDFSGYSDMAIGLARFFGFRFPENFNLPYTASTITDFWRRWHMSLSRWFRDYLYISLGGNRLGPVRTYLNLFVVFLLCGFWHGAAWTFVIWGMYHGVLLVFERLLKNRLHFEMKGVLGQLVTLLLVMVGWVFFRAESLGQAQLFLQTMFLGNPLFDESASYYTFRYYLSNSTIAAIVLGTIFSCFTPRAVRLPEAEGAFFATAFRAVASFALMLVSFAYLSGSTYQPFIYFRF